MKKFLMLLVASVLMLACSAGTALAADVEMKAFFFDNDTGEKLTTATKNVGVRILVTNNTTNVVGFDDVKLNNGIILYPMTILPPVSGATPDIRWYALTNQPAIGVGINQGTVAIQGGVFPVKDAVLEGNSGNTNLNQLKAGYYFPSVNITVLNHQSNQYQDFSAGKDPVEVVEEKGKGQHNTLSLAQVIADFHSTRLGYAATCSATVNSTINCDVTLTTRLYDISVANTVLTNELKQDLTELTGSVKAKNQKDYKNLSCAFKGVSTLINYDPKNKYMLQNVQCSI